MKMNLKEILRLEMIKNVFLFFCDIPCTTSIVNLHGICRFPLVTFQTYFPDPALSTFFFNCGSFCHFPTQLSSTVTFPPALKKKARQISVKKRNFREYFVKKGAGDQLFLSNCATLSDIVAWDWVVQHTCPHILGIGDGWVITRSFFKRRDGL